MLRSLCRCSESDFRSFCCLHILTPLYSHVDERLLSKLHACQQITLTWFYVKIFSFSCAISSFFSLCLIFRLSLSAQTPFNGNTFSLSVFYILCGGRKTNLSFYLTASLCSWKIHPVRFSFSFSFGERCLYRQERLCLCVWTWIQRIVTQNVMIAVVTHFLQHPASVL